MADEQPAPSEPAAGAEPAPPQSDAESIAAACVQATKTAMTHMQKAMKAAGHAPPGV